MNVVIIYNPKSTGDSEVNATELAAQIKHRNAKIKVVTVATKYAGHAEELAKDYARNKCADILISSSGDGGYNEVINGVMLSGTDSPPICAVLASGNANDHDRAIRDLPLAIAVAKHTVKPLDILKITVKNRNKTVTRYAHSYIGVGLTPIVAVELNRNSLTAIKEVFLTVRAFAKFQPLEIKFAGKEFSFDSLIISNIGGMAKIFKLAQKSQPDDGLFEVNLFPHGNKIGLVMRLLQGATIGLKPTKRTNLYSFTITKSMPIQLDGEVINADKDAEITVSCIRHGLTTLQ